MWRSGAGWILRRRLLVVGCWLLVAESPAGAGFFLCLDARIPPIAKYAMDGAPGLGIYLGEGCGGELPEFDAVGGGVERGVEGPSGEALVDGVDEDGAGGGAIADPVPRALGARPEHHGRGWGIEVWDGVGAGDSAGVEDRVLGEEGDLSDGVVGDRRAGRDAVVDEEGEVFAGLAVDGFVADQGTDGDAG